MSCSAHTESSERGHSHFVEHRWLEEPTECEREWAAALENCNRGRLPYPDMESLFDSHVDPFVSALRITLVCSGRRDFGPKTVPYLVIDRLSKWAASRGASPPSDKVKSGALAVATFQKNASFIRLAADTFRLRDERDIVIPVVKRLLDADEFNIACHCVIALGLHREFGRNELLVPLLLQDKICLIDDYLASRPELAVDFVAYLDDLVQDGRDTGSRLSSYIQARPVPDIKWEKLHRRSVGKLISRLCKKFDVSPEKCGNLSRMRALGGLRFLVRQRYGERSIGKDAWNDLVADALSENPHLLDELVSLIAPYDRPEADKWARRFGAPPLPAIQNARSQTVHESDSSELPLSYYELTIPSDRVTLVDDGLAFETILFRELFDVSHVGIDSEWKPSFGTKPSSVSLIQVSTRSQVFIFDVLALNEDGHARLWSVFADRIFNNPDVIKIGFGLDNDMREITSAVVGLTTVKYGGFGYLDLGRLWKSLADAKVSFPFPKVNTGEGLSSIVEQCFGSRLDKKEQCSNWERRPLRPSQIRYAAIDSHVLVRIYELLSNICSDSELNFEEMCCRVMEKSEFIKKKRRPKEK